MTEKVHFHPAEEAAKAAYALGDHLHSWDEASDWLREEYLHAIAIAIDDQPSPCK